MVSKITRRSVAALAGFSMVGSRAVAGLAQTTNESYAFEDGTVLEWTAPWSKRDTAATESILPGSVALFNDGGQKGELAAGVYAQPTTIDDAIESFMTLLKQDETTSVGVMGEEVEEAAADGSTVAIETSQLHTILLENESYGIYFQLMDGLQLSVIVAPVAAFADEFTSAQQSVTWNDTPIFDGAVGADLKAALDEAAAGGGEYTDASGSLHVSWT